MYKIFALLIFIFKSLFAGWRLLALVGLSLLVAMMGSEITAFRMEIPDVSSVHRIKGKFVNTQKGYSKSTLIDVAIQDVNGVIHRCNCEPKPYSNCITKASFKNQETIAELDKKILEAKTMQRAITKWAEGKEGELWLYPNKNFSGSKNSCYQMSVENFILFSFEDSAAAYKNIKNGFEVYVLWVYIALCMLGLLAFLIIQINVFFKGSYNDKAGD
jgi:hypothetical protein